MAEFIGPIEEKSGKKSLDDIVASIVGKREDRPDSDGIAGLRAPSARSGLGRGSVEEKANDLFKSMIYVAKKSDKETPISML